MYSTWLERGARLNGSCTVGGRCRLPCERVSGELSIYTKPFTPHGMWQRSVPWAVRARASTLINPSIVKSAALANHSHAKYTPCIKHNFNHPQPSPSASPPLSSLAPLPRPLLSLIVNKQLSPSGSSKCKLGTNGSTWTVLITWYVFHESQMV